MQTQQKPDTLLDNPSIVLPLAALLIGGSLACITLIIGELWLLSADTPNTGMSYQRYAPEVFVAGNALLYGLAALVAARRITPGFLYGLLLMLSSFGGAYLLWGEHFYWSQNYRFAIAALLGGGPLVTCLIRSSRPQQNKTLEEKSSRQIGLWTALVGAINVSLGIGAFWLVLPGVFSLGIGLCLHFSIIVRRLRRLRWLKQVAAGDIPSLSYQSSAVPEREQVPTLYLGELGYQSRIEQAPTTEDVFRTSAMNIIMRAPSDLGEASRVVWMDALFSLCVFPGLWIAPALFSPLERHTTHLSVLFDLDGDGYSEIISSDGASLEVRMGSSLGFSWPVALSSNTSPLLGGRSFLNEGFYMVETGQGPALLMRDQDNNQISRANTVRIRYKDRAIIAEEPPQFLPNEVSPKRSMDQGPQFEDCKLAHILVYDSYPEQTFSQIGEFEGDPCTQIFWAEFDDDGSKEVLIFVEDTTHNAEGIQIKLPENKLRTYYPQSTLSNSLRFNDFNGDGLMDATAISKGGVLNIYLQGQDGVITGQQLRLEPHDRLLDGDLNGDKDIDLLIIKMDDTIQILENDGAGVFSD